MFRAFSKLLILAFAVLLGFGLFPNRAFAQEYANVIVQPGDTLGKIAARYCTSWQQIYDINRQVIGPNPSAISQGMYLSVPNMCGSAVQLPGDFGVYDRGARTHASGIYNVPYYTVAWGDTLYSIGTRFGLSVAALQRSNGIGNSVNAGQVLVISDGGGNGTASPPRPQPPVSNAERVYFNNDISATRLGVISNGETKRYILGARAGQVMEIGTTSHGEPLTVTVNQPGGGQLALNGPNANIANNLWLRIPATGDYIVSVSPNWLPESPQMNFDITFVIQ